MGISKYDDESLGHEEDISANVGKDSRNSTSFSASPQASTERNCLARAEKKKTAHPHGDPGRVRKDPAFFQNGNGFIWYILSRSRRNCETDGIN